MATRPRPPNSISIRPRLLRDKKPGNPGFSILRRILWRLKYRFAEKEKRLAPGAYPEVTLAQARERQLEARRLLANGIDPGEHKKHTRRAAKVAAANTFEAIAREWFSKFSPGWAASHSSKVLLRLENDLFPWLGSRHMAAIEADELLMAVRRVARRA